MIELKLCVDEVDYEAVLRLVGENSSRFPGGLAAMASKALPERAKEDLAVKYLNSSADRLITMAEDAAAKNGIHLKISGAQARVV